MLSPIVLVRQLLPTDLKESIKSHSKLANILDMLAHMRVREIAPYNNFHTMLSPNEREYLFRLAATNNPSHAIVEIGCYAGGSSYFLGKGAEKSGSIVYTIDPFDSNLERQISECDGSEYLEKWRKPSKSEVEQNMRHHGLQERVRLIEGWSVDVALDWSIPIGTLFIDGNHKSTYEDYMAWKRNLAERAVVAFHDSNPNYQLTLPGVCLAVERVRHEDSFKKVDFVDSMTAFFK